MSHVRYSLYLSPRLGLVRSDHLTGRKKRTANVSFLPTPFLSVWFFPLLLPTFSLLHPDNSTPAMVRIFIFGLILY